jgi:glucans biosynthesis protein C
MNVNSLSSARRYDIDWLRVLLILTVFVFHSLRFFDLDGWHVKNAATYFGVQVVITFLSSWMMPLIFVISGAATYYALGKRGVGKFLKDRTLRLLVPLGVGIFTHVAWQMYLERVSHNQFSGSFLQWYPSYFNGLNGFGGNFAWAGNHLWYLEMLFLFSLICLPLLTWLRQPAGARVLSWMGNRLASPTAIYVPVLVIIALLLSLDPDSGVLATRDFGGWSLPTELVFFLVGFLLGSSEGMQAAIRRMRWVSLPLGIIMVAAAFSVYALYGDVPFGSPIYMLLMVLYGLTNWCWMLTILGFGLERLNRCTPFLNYANEAVLPFYILHQSVLLTLGFFVVGWAISDLAKWLIILVTSFALVMLLYEFLVRRINLLRVLFGMRPVRQEKRVQKPAVQVS